MRAGWIPPQGPAQAALRWSSRLGTKDPMAPSSRHLYPEWLRSRNARAGTPAGGPHDRQDDGAWRVWQWLRALDRRYATLVDLALAAALFVLCSGWVVERTGHPSLWFVAALIFPLVFRRRAPMTVFLVIAGGGLRPVARRRPGAGRCRAPRRALHGGARVRVAPRHRRRGHPRSRRRDGHGALEPGSQRRPVLRLPHRARLHRAPGRRGGAGPAQPARLAGRAGRAAGARARPAGVAGRGDRTGPHCAGDARCGLAQHPGDGHAGRRRLPGAGLGSGPGGRSHPRGLEHGAPGVDRHAPDAGRPARGVGPGRHGRRGRERERVPPRSHPSRAWASSRRSSSGCGPPGWTSRSGGSERPSRSPMRPG